MMTMILPKVIPQMIMSEKGFLIVLSVVATDGLPVSSGMMGMSNLNSVSA
jgi:hypothetical protein